MVNFLLARNSNPESEDKNGRKALDIAQHRGGNRTVQIQCIVIHFCRLQENRRNSFAMQQYELKNCF